MKSKLKSIGDDSAISYDCKLISANILENLLETLRVEMDAKIKAAMDNCGLELEDETITYTLDKRRSFITISIKG